MCKYIWFKTNCDLKFIAECIFINIFISRWDLTLSRCSYSCIKSFFQFFFVLGKFFWWMNFWLLEIFFLLSWFIPLQYGQCNHIVCFHETYTVWYNSILIVPAFTNVILSMKPSIQTWHSVKIIMHIMISPYVWHSYCEN